ncbi:MAG: cache domain-containing protein, partial [Alphaproteobacteria bacterium]|nr:cache domain-containing protein [Alphaproteobacteria bacterium]
MKRKFSIQITILVSFLMVLMLSCGSIIYYNYIKTTESFMEDVESDIQIKTNMILNDTQNYLMPAKITTQFMAWFSQSESNVLDAIDDITMQAMKMLELYPQIAGFFSGDSSGDFVAVRFVGEDATYPYGEKLPLPKNARYEVRIINRHSGLVTEFHKYLDKKGRVVALQEKPRSTEYFDPRHRPWYRGAEDTKKPYWSDPYIFLLSQKVGVTAATPVVNEEGKVKIVISAEITMDAISDLFTQHTIGKTGFAFIFNPQGEIVGYPNIHKLGAALKTSLPTFKDTKNPILIDAFKYYQKTKKMRFLISSEGMDYLIRFKEFGEKFEKTWLIGFIVPKKELTGPIDDITKLMMIFSLIIFLLS